MTGRRAGRRLGVAALLALVIVSAGLVGMARASAAVSTPSWVPLSPQSKPPAKFSPVAAYDPATQQFVLFGGGDSQNQPTGDTPAVRRRLTLTVRRSPTVTAITPARWHPRGGTRVTLAGTGFATTRGHTIVRVGRLTAPRVRCRSHTTCTVRAPAHDRGTVTVTATLAGLTSANRPAVRFTYVG